MYELLHVLYSCRECGRNFMYVHTFFGGDLLLDNTVCPYCRSINIFTIVKEQKPGTWLGFKPKEEVN